VELGDEPFSYLVDRIDVIKVNRVCVYEVKDYDDIENEQGEVIERRLRKSSVHLAFEVEIDIGYKKPIVRLYIDGFTGKELAIEYPFLD
jgi:type IV secretory pathway ATPase VirB11/archaellum biosynthesis ATPase